MMSVMIRAVLFDFYGVWTPDIFAQYLTLAEQRGPQARDSLEQSIRQYFRGEIGVDDIAGAVRYTLSRPDIDSATFRLDVHNVAPAIASFMREMHEHFVKLGVLANLGAQEYELLNNFNNQNQVLEAIGGPLPYQMLEPLLSNEVFVRALQDIGEPPENCLVVSGSQDYLNFAATTGMTTVPFEGFPKLRDTLLQLVSTEVS